MKYVFFMLLVANAAYFAWQWTRPPDPEPEGPRRDSGNIVLVSELRSPPPPARPVQRPPEPDVVAQELAAAAGEGCTGLGPLPDLEQAQALAERLRALEFSAEIQPLDELLPEEDFRVLIDPAPSLETAFRKLRELQSQDIDSYVIAQGSYALGISLGVYSTEEAAQEAQSAIQARGYSPSIVAMARTVRQYWVVAAGDIPPDLAGPEGEAAATSEPAAPPTRRAFACPAGTEATTNAGVRLRHEQDVRRQCQDRGDCRTCLAVAP